MMNTNELEELWNGTQSGISPDPDKILKLIRREESKETRRKIRMGLFGFNLTLASVLGGWALASGKATLADAWPALVCLLTLWATYVAFFVCRRRSTHALGLPQRDLRSVFRTMAHRAQSSWREIKMLLVVNVLTVIPLTVASVQRLVGTGKMSTQEAISFAAFALVVFGLNISVLAIYGLTRLRPRYHRLKEHLAMLDAREA